MHAIFVTVTLASLLTTMSGGDMLAFEPFEAFEPFDALEAFDPFDEPPAVELDAPDIDGEFPPPSGTSELSSLEQEAATSATPSATKQETGAIGRIGQPSSSKKAFGRRSRGSNVPRGKENCRLPSSDNPLWRGTLPVHAFPRQGAPAASASPGESTTAQRKVSSAHRRAPG
jgi:hypothetical protein